MLDSLYENIGKKIQDWAKWMFLLETVSAVITGIALMATDEELIGVGLLTLIFGPVVAWVSTWLLYAFGQLVEDTHEIRHQNSTANKNMQILATSIPCQAEEKTAPAAAKNTTRKAEPTPQTKAPVAASFVPDNPDAPYWCGNCGHSGPYDGACPACGSTVKRFNTGDTAHFSKTDKGTILCSACKTEQRADRHICWKCGATFIKES